MARELPPIAFTASDVKAVLQHRVMGRFTCGLLLGLLVCHWLLRIFSPVLCRFGMAFEGSTFLPYIIFELHKSVCGTKKSFKLE